MRIASAEQPTVLIYLLQILGDVEDSLAGLDRPEAVRALRAQVEQVMAHNEAGEGLATDRERVRVAHTARERRTAPSRELT